MPTDQKNIFSFVTKLKLQYTFQWMVRTAVFQAFYSLPTAAYLSSLPYLMSTSLKHLSFLTPITWLSLFMSRAWPHEWRIQDGMLGEEATTGGICWGHKSP